MRYRVVAACLILGAVFAVLPAAAAGSGEEAGAGASAAEVNKTGYPIVNEPITLRMMGPLAPGVGPWNELFLFTTMEKMTNVRFVFDTPPLNSYEERKNLAFASNDLPDLFFGLNVVSSRDQVIYGSQGLLVPLEGLVDQYGPNIGSLFGKAPNVRGSVTSVDGHIYSLPYVDEMKGHSAYGTRLWPDLATMKALGVTELPKDTDGLYRYLQAIKEKFPNMIPLSSANIDDLRHVLMPAFGLIGAMDTMMQEKDGKVVLFPADEHYKAYLEFLNRLYSEKLLDNQIFAQSQKELTAKGMNQQVGAFTAFAPFQVIKTTGPQMVDDKYPMFTALVSPANSVRVWPLAYISTPGQAAVTKGNKHREATMRWLDYFYTLPGAFLMGDGAVMDQAFYADTNAKFASESNIPKEEPNKQAWKLQHLTLAAGAFHFPQARADKYVFNVQWLYMTKMAKELIGSAAHEPIPQISFTPDEGDRLAVLIADLNPYVTQMEAKFIAGNEPLTNWPAYLTTLETLKVKEYVGIYQAAYDRLKKATK